MVSRKIKTIVACVLTLVFAFSMAGCGEKKLSGGSNGATTEATVAEATEEATEETAAAEDTTEADDAKDDKDAAKGKYYVASNLEDETIESFASVIKELVNKSQWDTLADLAAYPVCVNGKNVASKEDLLKLIDEKGVQESFIEAVKNASADDLSANSQGIMIGDGEVWFTDNATGDGLVIITLNTFVNE